MQVGTPNAGTSHFLPQAPQFRGSVPISAHTPSQDLSPLPHSSWQTRPRHTDFPSAGAGHASLHAPQWAVSVAKSTQLPLHAVESWGQTLSHLPLSHTWPTAHAFVQLPQCFGSFERSLHAASHREKLGAQVTEHAPVVQTEVPF